eukprot:CAMPEP_0195299854 /NCGR_PEP_ID=MMETSP0707-20130614/26307_1 /TAXON_ID=33640 /ORGANISM="Asterionellopsis glacialis, Strain CCMP134" /LENGTH=479 /DNA_ID=CAMNT_0040362365 /DNA_START=23 /DNA_END=1462 /DNA_ORIENTATION=+
MTARTTGPSSSANNGTMTSRLLSVLLLVSLCWLAQGSFNRDITMSNNSPHSYDVYWIHPQSGEATKLNPDPVTPGQNFPLQSYVHHTFQVRQVASPGKSTCDTPNDTCHVREFQVLETHEQFIDVVGDDFEIRHSDHTTTAETEASSVIDSCQSKATASLSSNPETAMDQFLECVEGGVATQLEHMNEEIAYQAKIRKQVGSLLENYTCADLETPTSPDVVEEEWASPVDHVSRHVHIKHERSASRIHYVENFISDQECRAMEQAAKPKLHRATVADGKGGSHFSENRKAMQAGIKVHWDKEHLEESEAQNEDSLTKHHIATLSRRVYDYANHVLGLDIQPNGQEDLMSIQYFGRGTNDTTPDRYTPHCDGDCTGLPHKSGTRMATMVMYCIMPTKGGATNFRNSGVHVHGQQNDAVFFSYIDPTTKVMDSGFTEHSGCPVLEGEKKIVTQWIRYGVDDENPWSSFNTLGIKYSEAADQ